MVFSVGDNISDTGNMRFVASKLESIKKSIEKYKRAKTELSYTDIWGAFGNMMDYIQFFNMGTAKSILKKSAGEKPNAWIRIKGNIIETSKQIKIGIAEARKLWRAVSAMHRGAEFRHGLVEDITGHQWSLNRYENDLLTAGCHRIAYNEMERIAKQLGWV